MERNGRIVKINAKYFVFLSFLRIKQRLPCSLLSRDRIIAEPYFFLYIAAALRYNKENRFVNEGGALN